MKKNRLFDYLARAGWKKWVQIMKLTAFLILLFVVDASASFSQSTKISVKVENGTLSEIFSKIEAQSEYRFFYQNEQIRDLSKKTVDVTNKNILDVVNELLKETELSCKLVDRNIIIFPKSENPLDNVIQQSRSVSGKVTDSSGGSLPGVSVVVKGTTTGTITDADGKYSLANVPANATLQFSFVGMKMQEVVNGGKSIINVTLADESIGIDEVVAIGYGVQSKRNVTGSISKVDMKMTESLPNTNLTQSLRGRVAGVQFTDNGRPGQNGTILVRGPRSLSGGNNPLIILDGAYFNGSLSDINTNDIESMDILKDASATAVYGSRAANGVILITTKRGVAEKPTIRINSFMGISDWSYKPKILSPERYIQKSLDARKQNGLEADPLKITEYLRSSESENYKKGKIVNPWNEISQFSTISSYDLNLSGRTNLTNYFSSFSLTDEKGLIYNDNQKRISLRTNIENKVTSWLTIGANTAYIKRDLSGNNADPASAYRSSPFGTWYYDDGTPIHDGYVPEDLYGTNTMWNAMMTKNEEIYNNLNANFYALIDIPKFKGLKYRLNYSPNYRWQHNYNFVPSDAHLTTNTSSASKFHREDFDWVVENIVTYNHQIKQDHAFDVTFLYSRNHFGWESTSANASQLSSNFTGWNNLGIGGILTNSSNASATEGTSSMFRLNYRFKERYLFTITARRDGCSVFSDKNKYGTFPSTAFAWIASEEPFFKKLSFVDNLKFRFSYGATGNQAINPYQSLTMVSTSQLYVFGNSGSSSIGSIPANMGNSNLKWETTYSTNLAVDFELFKKRLNGVIEVYDLNTKDLLVNRTLPYATGYTSILTNLGATSNKGIEITLNTSNIKRSDFEWNSSVVFSHNINKIVHLYHSDINKDGKEDNDLGNRWIIGEPINIAYDYLTNGIYQEGDVLPSGFKPGYTKLKDLNADGKIDAANDRSVLGQTGEPKFRWGITNNIRYKNVTLSFFINAMTGWTSAFGGYIPYNYGPLRAWNFFDSEWWTAENRSNSSPSLAYPNPYGQSYYVSRNFIRLQDISLTYDFTLIASKIKGIKSLQIYFSGKNLFTLTNWPGTDPETGGNQDGFPLSRTLTAGFNIVF